MLGLATLLAISIDGIPVSIGSAGPWALLVLVVSLMFRALLKGDLVPRKTHEDALHNAEMWRAAHMVSESARQEERDQKRQLLWAAQLSAKAVASLPVPTGEEE